MHRGYIKAWRAMADHPIWRHGTPEQGKIVMSLLWLASHKEKAWVWKGQKFTVRPGQMITSLESIAEKAGAGVTIQNVRTALAKFKKLEFLTDESTKQGRLITIINWSLYQSDEHIPNNQSNRQLTDDQQTANRQPNTYQEDKNVKELKNDKKEDKNLLCEKFDCFWKVYPRKVNKAGALKKWNATMTAEVTDPDQLILCAEKYSMMVKGKEDKYIMHPATFLGPDRRWRDFLDGGEHDPYNGLFDGLKAFCENDPEKKEKNITPEVTK